MPPSARQVVLVGILHSLLLVIGVQILSWADQPGSLSLDSLLQWDAVHYAAIRDHGYLGESSAFFPAFPLLWRISGLGIAGIAALNLSLYLSTTVLLARSLDLPARQYLVYAVLPSAFFFFTPYTEALFYCFSGLLLIGVHRGSTPMIIIGIFTCSMTRPAFTALVPAAMLVALVHAPTLRTGIVRCMAYVLTAITALIVVALIQHTDTGEYLGFYHAQQGYGNTFKIPDLPLRSWGGGDVTRLDAVALLAGLVCSGLVAREILLKWRSKPPILEPISFISAGYIAGVSAIALFLRGGEMYSLNRFVLATPFALIMVCRSAKLIPMWHWKQQITIWLGSICYFLLFASFVHIRPFLLFAAVGAHIVVGIHILSNRGQFTTYLYWPWIISTFSLQVYFFNKYLHGGWVA